LGRLALAAAGGSIEVSDRRNPASAVLQPEKSRNGAAGVTIILECCHFGTGVLGSRG